MAETGLLARAQQGDRAALDELCRLEWPGVYRLVAARVATRQEAEDLTQEVFVRALRHLEGYRAPSGSFRPYLAAVARNLLRDQWRRPRSGTWTDQDPDSLPAPDGGPEEALLAGEERDELLGALSRLPAVYQDVLRLRLVERRSAEETGKVLRRKPDAVRQLQHRALVALRGELRGDGEGELRDG